MVKGLKQSTAGGANQCAFISLYDFSILGNTKLPEGITDVVIWYRKEGDDFWGVTAKGFDQGEAEEELSPSNQFTIKVTWVYKGSENVLVPTLPSEDYIETISGEAVEKLKGIKEKHKLNLRKKKTPGDKKKIKKEKAGNSD